MGRLDDIIRRNRQPRRFGERLTVGIGLALFLLIVIVLLVFTDLGLPPEVTEDASTPVIAPGERRLDDVPMMRPRPRAPAAPAQPWRP